ncbi:hypothetical protein D6817_05745 [Candidatus Pacearchaeota archaeon]|nr:MAG: hypothetical protein D6817_05745 [Candidatus Pacearchaeota archaeon]
MHINNLKRIVFVVIFTTLLLTTASILIVSFVNKGTSLPSEPDFSPTKTGPVRKAGTLAPVQRPNIVLILTDDQRYDTVDFMPFVANKLKKEGVVFTNAFVSNPVCCPSRASFLSGGFFSHWSGVLNNNLPNGGVWNFHDERTLATELQKNGYNTILVGKYLNGYLSYAQNLRDKIPPGWTEFWGTNIPSSYSRWKIIHGFSRYNSRGRGQVLEITTYPPKFLRTKALEALEKYATQNRPFFLFYSSILPHTPAIPSREFKDDEIYTEFLTQGNFVYRGRGWGEQPEGDISDKPFYVRVSESEWWGGDPSFYDNTDFKPDHHTPDDLFAHRLQSLLSVDRAVEEIYKKLDELGELNNTIFIFTSDNGYLMGEHKKFGKRMPYEESIRIPLIVWFPGVEHKYVDDFVYWDLDVPNTIFDYAGAPSFEGTNGMSLRDLINGLSSNIRSEIFAENFKQELEPLYKQVPDWAMVRNGTWKYVWYNTLEEELYNLLTDPYELNNLANNTSYSDVKNQLAAEVDTFKGLTILKPLDVFPGMGNQLPNASVGEPYYFRFYAEGGNPPYNWSWRPTTVGDILPPGLILNAETGEITGTPTAPNIDSDYQFYVEVTDNSTSPFHGGPQRRTMRFRLTVLP